MQKHNLKINFWDLEHRWTRKKKRVAFQLQWSVFLQVLWRNYWVYLRLEKVSLPANFWFWPIDGERNLTEVRSVITKKRDEQLHWHWIITPATRCVNQELTRDFTLWPSAGPTCHHRGCGRGEENSLLALKAAEFASPAIKTTLTLNTNRDSAPHKLREKKNF